MKHEIVICMGSSCFARGNRKHLLMIEQYLADHGLTESVVLTGSRCEDQCRCGCNIEGLSAVMSLSAASGDTGELRSVELLSSVQRRASTLSTS